MEKRENDAKAVREDYSRTELAGITRAKISAGYRFRIFLRKRKKLLIMLIYLVLIVFIYLAQTNSFSGGSCGQNIPFVPQIVTGSDLAVHVIDVGQGDCTLVQGGGVNILIDAGENGMGDRVVNYLLNHGIYRLELIILTHPHSDHIGGADTVINEPLIRVGTVIMPDIPDDLIPLTRTYEDVLDAIDGKGCGLRFISEDISMKYGEMTLDIFAPFTYPWIWGPMPPDDLNFYSLCTRFECGGNSFLSCGDLTETGEQVLLSRHGGDNGYNNDLKSTLFKASHHGSRYSNSQPFLEAVSPEYVFIPVGRDNEFGHPSKRFTDALREMGVKYERTDKRGSFIYRFGVKGKQSGMKLENAA